MTTFTDSFIGSGTDLPGTPVETSTGAAQLWHQQDGFPQRTANGLTAQTVTNVFSYFDVAEVTLTVPDIIVAEGEFNTTGATAERLARLEAYWSSAGPAGALSAGVSIRQYYDAAQYYIYPGSTTLQLVYNDVTARTGYVKRRLEVDNVAKTYKCFANDTVIASGSFTADFTTYSYAAYSGRASVQIYRTSGTTATSQNLRNMVVQLGSEVVPDPVVKHGLARVGRRITTPEVPPVPYQPERTVTTSQVAYPPLSAQGSSGSNSGVSSVGSWSTGDSGWAYTYVIEDTDDGGLYISHRELVYIGADTQYKTSAPGPVGSNSVTITTTTHYPEVPASPGIPGYITDIPPRGWTAFAHSISEHTGSSAMSFSVKPKVVGVAVGFGYTNVTPTVGYGHIRDGLLFTDNKVSLLVNGAPLGPYVPTDEFLIQRKRTGSVTIKRNGTLIDTHASQDTADLLMGPNVMTASLYSLGDELYATSFVSLPDGGATMVMPEFTLFGRQGTKAQAIMVVPALTLVAVGGHGPMLLPALQMFASDRVLGQGVMETPEFEVRGYGGSLTVVLNSGADMSMPWFYMYGLSATVEDGAAAMVMPALTLMAADRPYGKAAMTTARFVMTAYNEEADEAFLLESCVYNTPYIADNEIVVVAMSGFQVTSFAVPGVLLDALANSTALVTTTAITNQILEAIAWSYARFGGVISVPGLGGTTWAFNVDALGSTTYSNYDFNSYAQVGEHYYGANSRGVYLLEGDTDSGDPIRANISFGVQRFSQTEKKTVEQCYLGMSAEGNLFVKIIAEGNEYIYKTRSFSTELQQQRVTPGKGLRTNYVTLEVYNEEGQDFELDTVKFVVADMKRRI